MADKKLFLLDAYALIFRAYYAFIRNPMYNSKGLNTSAIFGFLITLDEILRNQDPTHIAVVFDSTKPTFRKEIFREYKANREETPEEIKASVPYIKKILEAFHIPIIQKDGYEADDVIGSLSRKAVEQGYETYMMTPDKDFAQLVNDRIFVYKPKRAGNEAEVWDTEWVKKKFHVERPEQVIDILALWGDSSDNIPGAPGIGEKTAKKLIEEFGSVEELLRNTGKLKGKQKENIEQNKEQILLSKKLATIILDVPIAFMEKEMALKEPDIDKLGKIYKELEFKTLLNKLKNNNSKPGSGELGQKTLFSAEEATQASLIPDKKLKTLADMDHNYELSGTDQAFNDLKGQSSFCFDTETTSINPHEARLVGIAFCRKVHRARYISFQGMEEQAIQKELLKLKPLFEDKSVEKIGQNIKYDMEVLAQYKISVQGPLFDTMIAHYLIQPELRHNLDNLAASYLDYQPVSIESLVGPKGKGQGSMDNVPLEDIKEYACEDADVTWQLAGILKKELKEHNLTELAQKVEMPLIKVLADMELYGVKINTEFLNNYAGELRRDILKLEQEIHRDAGVEFNVSSPKQLGEILFDRLRIISDAKKTKSKQYSTSEEVLLRLKDKHPIVKKVLEYRALKKLLSTYVEALPKLVNTRTGKIHTSFNQAIAATGRLSSHNPNLQNIPVREERGREIRKAFVPSAKRYKILSADYSQIELRLMAHMSGDRNMIEAFRNHEDIHTTTASKIYNIDPGKVNREQRGRAKTANFGIIYGISAFGLSQRLNIDRSEAGELIEGYFKNFPSVRKYRNQCIELARNQGWVSTLMGRKRYLKDIQSRNSVVRGFAERNAINAPIQGSAADIIKLAMIRIHRRLEKENYRARMILQVHDELVLDVPEDELENVQALVVKEMEQAYILDVPMEVEASYGDNWLEAH